MNRPIISLFWSQIDTEQPNAVYVQARYRDGGTVAQLRLEVSDKAGWIGSLFVGPGYRKRGLASLLLGRAFGICRQMGFESVGLTVAHKNDDAKRLYKKMGFVGFTDGYEGYQQLVKPLI